MKKYKKKPTFLYRLKRAWALPSVRRAAVSLLLAVVAAVAVCANIANTPKEKAAAVVVETEEVEDQIPARTYFDVPLSTDIQDCIFEECEKYNVSPALVVAVIERESKCDLLALGDNGRSFGLMQIQPKWHLQRMVDLGCTDLLDPYQNIKVGVDYLAELQERNPNIYWVLMAYNGGAGYANNRAASGNISEYATSVVARAYEMECE